MLGFFIGNPIRQLRYMNSFLGQAALGLGRYWFLSGFQLTLQSAWQENRASRNLPTKSKIHRLGHGCWFLATQTAANRDNRKRKTARPTLGLPGSELLKG